MKKRIWAIVLSVILMSQTVTLPVTAASVKTNDTDVKSSEEVSIDSVIESAEILSAETEIETAETEIESTESEMVPVEIEVETTTVEMEDSCILEQEAVCMEETAMSMVESNPVRLFQEGYLDVCEPEPLMECSPQFSIVSELNTAREYENLDEIMEYLYEQLKNMETEIDFEEYQVSTDDISKIYGGVINEHPDLYFVKGSISYYYMPNSDGTEWIITRIIPQYVSGLDDELFDNAVKDALLCIKTEMSDLEKAIALHDYIVLNCKYEYDKYLNGTLETNDYSAYGILAEGNGVCNGYALAYKYLCNLVGIECNMVTSEVMDHAWNLIKLNGEYYHVDTTWDDPVWDRIGRVRHYYMFSSDASFIRDREHNNWSVIQYGEEVSLRATDTSYDDYFWMNSDSALIYDNHDYYYIDNTYNNLMKIDISDMSSTEICSIGKWRTWENNGTWSGCYSGLFMSQGRLFYNDKDNIYSIDPMNITDKKTEFRNPKANEGYIYGCTLSGGDVKYTISTTPNANGYLPVYIADLDDSVESAIERVVLSEERCELILGKSMELTYLTYPTYAVAKTVSWMSDDVSVATVNDGIVTAVDEGKCNITVIVDGVSDTCEITVKRKVDKPVFSPEGNTIDTGDSVTITAEEGAIIYYTCDGTTPTEDSEIYSNPIVVNEDMTIRAFATKEGYENSDIREVSYIACENVLEFYNTELSVMEEREVYIWYDKVPTTKDYSEVVLSSADESIAKVVDNMTVLGVSEGETVLTASVEDHKGRLVTAQATIKVTPVMFKVSFIAGNNYYAPQWVKKGEDAVPITLPQSHIPNGYEFVGWDGSYKNIQADTVLTAVFRPINYKVNYIIENGSNVAGNVDEYTIESDTFSFLEPSVSAGYRFEGWYADSEYTESVSQIEAGSYGDVTIYAKIVPIAYQITYELGDGTNHEENVSEYTVETDTIVLNKPDSSYEDIFIGWYKDADYTDEITQIEKGSTGNLTVFALWKLAEPVFSTTQSRVSYGTEISIEAARQGAAVYYTTDGSIPSKDSNLYSAPIVVDRDMTIKAIAVLDGYVSSEVVSASYTPVETFMVRFLDRNGIVLKEEIVKAGMDATAPPLPITPYGYRFIGWDRSFTNINADIDITAQYEAIKYSITYILPGGMNNSSNPTEYTIETDDILLIAPEVEEGISFIGWYDNEEGNGEPIEKIKKGSVGNITLYAICKDERGLWMENIDPLPYTGKKVKPAHVKVYDGGELLDVGKDYTISYKNNINVNDLTGENLSNAPTVVITGIGNYQGVITKNFMITPKNIEDFDVTIDTISLKYKKDKEQKAIPQVKWNGKTWKNNKDFIVSYPDEGKPGAYIEPGEYRVCVEGVSNFTGKREIVLTIADTEEVLMSKVKVIPIPKQLYNGTEVDVDRLLVLKYQNEKLTLGMDYELAYAPCIEVGTHTVMITGIGKYKGVLRTSFKISGVPMNKVVVTGVPKKVYYTGNEMTMDDAQWKEPVVLSYSQKVDGKMKTIRLEPDEYSVTYKNNDKCGSAQIIFTGKKGYTGTVKKSFTISPYNITEDSENKVLALVMNEPVYYQKGGSQPVVKVLYGLNELVLNKDYKVSYRNNGKVNREAVAIVTGVGNYTGKKELTFAVNQQDIGRLEMTAPDLEEGKAGKYKSVPVLTDVNGKKLVAGIDYEATLEYQDAEGRLLGKDSKVSAPNTVTVTVYGRGNYYGKNSVTYRIVGKKMNISKANVSIVKDKKWYYSGESITISEEDIIVKIGNKKLLPENYEIVSYSNNIKKGTATAVIRGKGEYGGTKRVNFKISRQVMKWWEKKGKSIMMELLNW